jgi:hypothetical protein
MKLGCFKIETGENIVTIFIGLRAKMYCYTIENQRSGGYTVLKKRKRSAWTCNKQTSTANMEESFR